MEKYKLIASSGSEGGILKLINEYFCSTSFVILEIDGIKVPGKPIEDEKYFIPIGFRVYRKKQRYRFEMKK